MSDEHNSILRAVREINPEWPADPTLTDEQIEDISEVLGMDFETLAVILFDDDFIAEVEYRDRWVSPPHLST